MYKCSTPTDHPIDESRLNAIDEDFTNTVRKLIYRGGGGVVHHRYEPVEALQTTERIISWSTDTKHKK